MTAMKPKKKLSKFGKAALEVAADIANLPLDGTKEIAHTAQKIKNKRQQRKRTKKSAGKPNRSSKPNPSR